MKIKLGVEMETKKKIAEEYENSKQQVEQLESKVVLMSHYQQSKTSQHVNLFLLDFKYLSCSKTFEIDQPGPCVVNVNSNAID